MVGETARADILVVAPHPDDDVITSSGVIVRALERGEEVHVVFMTNGDVDGVSMGLLRQDEAVAAQAELGVAEENLIFLGYPDTDLNGLYFEFPDPGDVLDHNGQTTTYGARGLGRTDYHSYRFGSPATYNGFNVTNDLADVLLTLRPDHVFVTSEWDGHADHRATYLFLRDAVDLVRLQDPTFDPVVHKTLVWASPEWPNAGSPLTYFEAPANLSETALAWSQRESLDVPLALQRTDLLLNPKHRAIERHASQGGNGSYLSRYLHKDEFFWPERASGNQPPVPDAGLDQEVPRGATAMLDGSASFDPDSPVLGFHWRQVAGYPVVLSNPHSATPTFLVPDNLTRRESATFELVVYDELSESFPDAVTVVLGSDILPPENVALQAVATASSENVATGQLAAKAIDGFIEGAPGDHTREWATVGQGAGAWIELTWSKPQVVDSIALADRPNPSDWILAGTLIFSDGSTLPVGELDNDGTRTWFHFTPRLVSSVRFEITAVSPGTINVGLAEFQVFSPSVMPGNMPPVAVVGPEQFVGPDTLVHLHGEGSYDPEGASLTFEWTQLAGPPVVLSGASTATPSFRTPAVLSSPVVYLFQLVVRDGQIASTPVFATVVAEPPRPANVALEAAVTASSQNAGTSQLASKAIDGVADGAPGDFTREWATLGEGIGAWIELSWETPQSIDRVVLHDRPNSADHVLAGLLTFSDGTSVAVGALADDGSGTTVSFAPKLVTSVRFTVTAVGAGTVNVGLAEMQVWSVVGAIDYAPVARAGADQTVEAGAFVELDGSGSYDPAGQALTYQWVQTGGPAVALSNAFAVRPTFQAPAEVAEEEILTFELSVSDGTFTAGPVVTRVKVQPPAPPPPPPAPVNLALDAVATASSAAPLQEAHKVNDGSTLGYPVDGTREWSSQGQGIGAWIQLTWPTAQLSNEIVLYDRPNLDDHIVAAKLLFSDGFELDVGPLDNAGGPTVVSFSPRYFFWVRLTVTAVSGSTANIGLAEMEVSAYEPAGANFPPVAAVGGPLFVKEGELVTLEGDASYDPDGEVVAWLWTQVAGTPVVLSNPAAPNPTFVAPAASGSDLLFELVVTDDDGADSDPVLAQVTVLPPPPPPNLALAATATASTSAPLQGPEKAVDGHAVGYPVDGTREWSSSHEQAGAWIELSWAAPQTSNWIVLHDRPNGDDQILSATLTFSDGSSVAVGALDNLGGATHVHFETRTFTWVRLTVDSVSPSTANVGLSEFIVYAADD